jgi:hypothetical protein
MIKLLLLFVAIIIVIIVKYIQLKRKESLNRTSKNYFLKERGKVLSIKPDELLVKSNNYWEEKGSEVSKITMVDALYNSERNFPQEQKFRTVLIYDGLVNDRPVKYISPSINLDEVTLRYRLFNVPEVKIYIDKQNGNNYYFDLSFLQD